MGVFLGGDGKNCIASEKSPAGGQHETSKRYPELSKRNKDILKYIRNYKVVPPR